MNARLRELELRRELLVLRSRALRSGIELELAALGGRVAGVDRTVAALRGLVHSPLVLVLAGVVAVTVGPLRALRWAGRGLVALSLARRLSQLLGRSA